MVWALTVCLMNHTSARPDVLSYSWAYFLLLLFLASIGTASLVAALALTSRALSKIASGLCLTGLSLALSVGLLEMALRTWPGRLVTDSLRTFIQPNSSLYLRSVVAGARDVALFDSRMECDGMYFHYKPDIRFEFESDVIERAVPIRIDEVGFRNSVGTFTSNEQISYVFLGDSGTIGLQVESTFADVFEQLSGQPTLNLGIGAQGAWHYAESFARYGVIKRPEYVFVTMFLNDGLNDRVAEVLASVGMDRDHYAYITYAHRGFHPPNGIFDQLAFSCFATNYLEAATRYLRSVVKETGSAGISELSELRLSDGQVLRISNLGIQRPEDYVPDGDWSATVRALRRIQETAIAVGATPVLTYIVQPSSIYYPQLDDHTKAEFLPYSSADFADDFGWPRLFANLAHEAGMEFLDPRQALSEAARESPFLYLGPSAGTFRIDRHLGVRGHEVYARMFDEYIADYGTHQ